MKLRFIIILIFSINQLQSQDGSDMLYYAPQDLDYGVVGKLVHLDFNNDSFGSRVKDTVNLSFAGFNQYKEVRNDNGFNNWYYSQYLESVGDSAGYKMRIQKMELLRISKDNLWVKAMGHYFKGDKEVFSTFIIEKLSISREDIVKVLVYAEPAISMGLSIYRVYRKAPQKSSAIADCDYCFEPKKDELFSHPIISDYEIEQYDFENQRITLGPAAKRALDDLKINNEGMPVALTLDGEIIYGFWLWNSLSSVGCDYVFANALKIMEIRFQHQFSKTSYEDPRFDPRLREYATKRNSKK